MSEYRDAPIWEQYLAKLHGFFRHPDKFGETLDLFNNPKDVAEFHAALVRIVERQERLEWLWRGVKMAGGIFMAVGLGVIMIRDVLPILLRALVGIQ